LGAILATPRNLVGGITKLDALLHPIEQRRGDGDITIARKTIAHRPDVAVDAEDFLRHDQRTARSAIRIGAVRRQARAIACDQLHPLSHCMAPALLCGHYDIARRTVWRHPRAEAGRQYCRIRRMLEQYGNVRARPYLQPDLRRSAAAPRGEQAARPTGASRRRSEARVVAP